MPATGSTRTATRWRSCSRAAAVLVALAASACVTTTTRFYVPAAAAARLTPDQMREQVHAVMPLECPRLVAKRDTTFGVVTLAVFPDAQGAVQRAEIRGGSGDATFDDLIGALAAQLQLPPPGDAPGDRRERRVVVSYSCAPHASLVRVVVPPR